MDKCKLLKLGLTVKAASVFDRKNPLIRHTSACPQQKQALVIGGIRGQEEVTLQTRKLDLKLVSASTIVNLRDVGKLRLWQGYHREPLLHCCTFSAPSSKAAGF